MPQGGRSVRTDSDSSEAIGIADNPMDLDCEADVCGDEEVCNRTVTLGRLLQRDIECARAL